MSCRKNRLAIRLQVVGKTNTFNYQLKASRKEHLKLLNSNIKSSLTVEKSLKKT